MRAVQRVHDDARAEPRRPRPQAAFPDHGIVPRPDVPTATARKRISGRCWAMMRVQAFSAHLEMPWAGVAKVV